MRSTVARVASPDFRAVVAIVALLIAFFSPVWAQGRFFLSDGQFAAFFAPISVWSNAWIGGWPAGADTAAYVWYPMRLIVLWSHLGFNAFVLSAYIIAALGAHAYLRIVGVSVAGSALGGVSFALSGFLVAHLGHTSMIHAAAWVPWVFASIEGCLSRERRRWAVVGAIAVAMSCLAGHMQIAFYGLFFASLYLAWRFAYCWRHRRIRAWMLAFIGIVVGILIAAPHLLMTVDYVEETTRAAMDYDGFVSFSLPRLQLSTVLFPFLFGGNGKPLGVPYFGAWNFTELCFYTPFLSIALALPGCLFRRRDIAAFWIFLAIAALLLALGGSIPALARTMYVLPGFNMFRVPARHLMEFNLAISVLAAFGLDWLRAAQSRASLRRYALVVGALAVLAVTLSAPPQRAAQALGRATGISVPPWPQDPAIWAGIGGIAVGLVGLWVLASRRRYSGVIVGAIALIGLAEYAWLAEWRYLSTNRNMEATAIERDIAARLLKEGGRVLYADGPWGSRLTSERTRKFDIPSVNWYGPLIPRRAANLLQTDPSGILWPQALFPENVVLDIYGVRFVAIRDEASERNFAQRAALVAPRWRQVGRDAGTTVYENLRALPLAWLCSTWRDVSAKVAIDTLQEATTFDPRREALVSGLGSGGAPRSDSGTANARWEGHGTIVADVDAPGDSLLVFSVNDIKGWTATMDGVRQTVYNVNYALVGLPVPKGSHSVKLEYRVPTWRWAAPWSTALLGFVAISAWPRRWTLQRE